MFVNKIVNKIRFFVNKVIFFVEYIQNGMPKFVHIEQKVHLNFCIKIFNNF